MIPDYQKKKIELMSSIMRHPKLSKMVRDAMSAPIGSTKRVQAKSILSIMRKAKGIRFDGQGGPLSGVGLSTISGSPTNTINPNLGNNNSNALGGTPMIFPPAPEFNQTGSTTPASNLSLSPSVPSLGGSQSTYSSVIKPSLSSNTNEFNTITGQKLTPGENYVNTAGNTIKEGTSFSPSQNGNNIPPTSVPVSSTGPASAIPSVNNTNNNQTSFPTPNLSQAVKSNMGAGEYALEATNAKFGGDLGSYVQNQAATLRKTYGLDNLESQLSDLVSKKDNIIPTLTAYTQGKDKYMNYVDNLISQTEAKLPNIDMSDPVMANSYNNYVNYLYTLKGMQSQRENNFINTAVSSYQADVNNVQTKYTDALNSYNTAMTTMGTIDQNTYSTTMQAMTDAYNATVNAPTVAANLSALNSQNLNNQLQTVQNAFNLGYNYDMSTGKMTPMLDEKGNPVGPINGGGVTFTPTQINKAATNANTDPKTFYLEMRKDTSGNFGNFFVNPPKITNPNSATGAQISIITPLNTLISNVRSGSTTTTDAITKLSKFGLPDIVNQYYIGLINKVAPAPVTSTKTKNKFLGITLPFQ